MEVNDANPGLDTEIADLEGGRFLRSRAYAPMHRHEGRLCLMEKYVTDTGDA